MGYGRWWLWCDVDKLWWGMRGGGCGVAVVGYE